MDYEIPKELNLLQSALYYVPIKKINFVHVLVIKKDLNNCALIYILLLLITVLCIQYFDNLFGSCTILA